MKESPLHSLTPRPPLGWNSFDCYGTVANEQVLTANLEVFVERLKPHGYEYFTLDAGWYREYDIPLSENFPLPGQDYNVNFDTYGRVTPAACFFPKGLNRVAGAVHRAGLKFGLHLMRGIPRAAVEKNTLIKGTDIRARDIANTEDTCPWCPDNYGIDMEKPGAQKYYNSVIELVASWGVDFIKYDDIVPSPPEVDAVANAVEACDREIVLSLSPGNRHQFDAMDTYRRANMMRISGDVWDNREDIDEVFERWKTFSRYVDDNPHGFWFDQDMIPLGRLCVWNPRTPKREDMLGEDAQSFERSSQLTDPQKRTFITMRALAASPLIMGGELRWTDYFGFYLLTHPGMLACNQNGVVGKLMMEDAHTYVWKTPARDNPAQGWFGVFNRHPEKMRKITVSAETLELSTETDLRDVWRNRPLGNLKSALTTDLDADDVLFVRYGKHEEDEANT